MSVLWELTRSTAMVGTVALSATTTLGVLASSPTGSLPRFVAQTMHRRLATLAVALVAAHVVTVLADPYVPLTWADGVVPFRAAYKGFGTALGTVAVDLLLLVLVTSAFRGRLGARAWRGVHLGTYLLWPVVVAHGLLIGTDDRAVQWICLGGTAGVVLALVWRLGLTRTRLATR